MNRSALIPAVLGAAGLFGCGGGGRLDLILDLPDPGPLRPEGMTTVTVVAQPFEDDPVATTSTLDGNRFEAGDLPAGESVSLAVELRDGTGRLVGYGRALAPVELSADQVRTVRIAVRRPFLYAMSATGLVSFDPTRSTLDADYQNRLAPAQPVATVPVGGDQIAVVSATGVSMIATETHMVTGAPIALAGITDAAQVPGARRIVVGLPTGMAVVDVDSGGVEMIPGGPVSRVAVGVLGDGRVMAWGLINRITPPEVNEPCPAGTSQLLAADLASPGSPATTPLGIGLADIAAGVDAPALVGAAPCTNQVVSIDGEQTMSLGPLQRAAQVAIQGTRVWAVGTRPAVLVFAGPSIDYVDVDAIGLVGSVDIRGGTLTTVELRQQRQQMNDSDDGAHEHAQVMKPMSALPLDMVVLAGGEFIAIATRYKFHSNALPYPPILIALPTMDATTADVLLIGGGTNTVAQRIRSKCDLVTGSADIFPNWECAPPETGQVPEFGPYEATALGALFGAR